MVRPVLNKHGIDVALERIAEFCRRWSIREFALFGSILRDDFRPDSDVDVLVDFADDARWGLFDLCRMEEELRAVFGREVDLVTRRSVEESPNYIRRRHILGSVEILGLLDTSSSLPTAHPRERGGPACGKMTRD